VARRVDSREALVAEAGTGVGKTFAYLVPLLLSGGRALVSTATKSLQDQLFLRDLPRLRDALGVPVRMALLKGRASYLCRTACSRRARPASCPTALRCARWPASSLGAVHPHRRPGRDRRPGRPQPVIPLVTSTRDNCLGTECPEFRACHVVQARREAMAADLVVVNHHLFFADMALRDSGVAELLPTVDAAVFDEAHQLVEAGVQFLGTTLATGQAIDFGARPAGRRAAARARPAALAANWPGRPRQGRARTAPACAGPLRDMRGMLKLRWDERQPRRAGLQAAGPGRCGRCGAATRARRWRPRRRRTSPAGRSARGPSPRWPGVQPAAAGRPGALDRPGPAAGAPGGVAAGHPRHAHRAARAGARAWIFTSATLGDDDALSWFTESRRWKTPASCAWAARSTTRPMRAPGCRRAFPSPTRPATRRRWVRSPHGCAAALGGRTFVLTTTLRVLPVMAEALRREAGRSRHAAGGAGAGHAAQARAAAALPRTPGSVLVGSQSFWEGIDVPGDALQCVVIDKLPFPPPNDPLVQARSQAAGEQGRDPFDDYFVPKPPCR
jgi:ATP-dependent DNA helicase DinG